MRFAIVNSATLVVMNVCEWEGSEWLPPYGTYIVQSDVANMYDVYDPLSGSFTAPEPIEEES